MAKKATKRRAWTPGINKDDGSEENARWTHRQDAEAKRGCHAAKGFQHGTIARLASLRLGKQPASRCVEAPPCAGLFI